MLHMTVLQDSSFEEINRFLEAVESQGTNIQNSVGHGGHAHQQSLSLEARLLENVMLSLQA